jgi:hypothetical protein
LRATRGGRVAPHARQEQAGCPAALYEERNALAKINAGFAPLAKDFIGMQANGVNANPLIPVHPGLTRVMKERNAWNDKWKNGVGAI